MSEGLTKSDIENALRELSDELALSNIKGELCLFGGSVMVLAFSARMATKDVDAIFEPTQDIRNAVKKIGENHHWPTSWLNDGVKGFVSLRHEVIEGNLPQFPNLHLTMPTPEYLLAMKCMASRIDYSGDEAGDTRDIRFLIRHLNLKDSNEVLSILSSYYPQDRIPIKAQYLVESLFEEDAT